MMTPLFDGLCGDFAAASQKSWFYSSQTTYCKITTKAIKQWCHHHHLPDASTQWQSHINH
jgi:hypothetical protein